MYRGHIGQFYRWAAENGWLPWDPSENLPRTRQPKRRPKPCTDEELAFMLRELGDPWRLWAVLAAYGGLRCCEISRLDRDDIDERGLWLLGKGNRLGWVPQHPVIWNAVEDLPSGLVAQGIDAHYVSKSFRERAVRLGLRAMSLHRLRHWYATTLLRAGANLPQVQRACRHASISTTSQYTEILDSEVDAAVLALPALA